MRLQDNYDWIVLGNHPGALLTACLVARLGLSVLMLPLGSHSGLTVSRSGQHLDPEPNYLIGLGKSGKSEGLVLQVLSQLGMTPSERERIQIPNGIPQVLTPENRLSLLPTEHLALELSREFGKTGAKQLGLVSVLKQVESDYLSFWQGLPKRLTLSPHRKSAPPEPMSLGDLQRRFVQNRGSNDVSMKTWISRRKRLSDLCESLAKPELNEVSQGLWYAITGNVASDPVLFDILHMFSLARTGSSFKGGLSAYREYLVNLAKRLGVQIPVKVECRRLFIDRGRFAGVQVTNRGNMISVGGGVLGCSLENANQRMAYTGRSLFRRNKRPVTPKGWRFTIGLTVHREAIPIGMESRLVWQEKDAPVLEIEVVNPKDYALDDPDHCVLYLRTLMPFHPESLSHEYQRVIAGRMLRQAVEIIPFLEYHVTRMYPDFRIGKNPDSLIGLVDSNSESGSSINELSKVYPFQTLDAIPENWIIYSGYGIGSSTGIDGLFTASDEAYPELGNLGPTVAALEAVAWLAHRSGMPGPLA